MTLLQRILNDNRKFVIAIAIALSVNVLFYLVAVYPLKTRAIRINGQTLAAEEAFQLAQDRLEGINRIKRQNDEANRQLLRFYREVLPVNLSGARSAIYTRLFRLIGDLELKYERRNVSEERGDTDKLSRVSTRMVISGKYHEVREFIYKIELAQEFFLIDRILLEQKEEGPDLTLTLDVSTYYWIDGREV